MINVQDVINRISDHIGNYSTGQANTDHKIRAADYAVNYLKKRVAFPLDEKKTTFDYSQDTIFYDMPVDFMESLGLFYDDVNLNFPETNWEYRPYLELKRRTGAVSNKNYWSHTTENGTHQLALVGRNLNQGTSIESFDSALWGISGDTTSIAFDTNVKIEGSASQKINITASSNTATIVKTGLNIDVRAIHENNGFFKVYSYIKSLDILRYRIEYGTDSSNYYTISTTTQSDGTAFALNEWNLLSFASVNKVMTGSPNDAQITYIKLHIDLDVGFGTVNDFRFDWLYTVIPDKMDFLYRTKYKATNQAGTTYKTKLTDIGDILLLDEEWIEPIALKGALYIQPALKGDINFFQLYKMECEDVIKQFARTWPRIRENNYLGHRLLRR